jgi:Ala-tRNA(Pro) deacylase
MPAARLKKFLDENHIKYVSISHSPAFTAQEIAAASHTPGRELAKSVIVKLDGKMTMAVLPASYFVDLERLAAVAGASEAELATEQEFKSLFPGCEPGAMPPFGNLYGMKVFASAGLEEDEQISFNAGSHIELVRLAYKDFKRLVEPQVASFSTRPQAVLT